MRAAKEDRPRKAKKAKTEASTAAHACDIDCCRYVAKTTSSLKRHLTCIHNIGVTWHECDEKGCSFLAKKADSVRTHKANVHGVAM